MDSTKSKFRNGAIGLFAVAVAGLLTAGEKNLEPTGACLLELAVVTHRDGERTTVVRVFDNGRVEACSPKGEGACVVQKISVKEAKGLAVELERAIEAEGLSTETIAEDVDRESLRTGLPAVVRAADECCITCQTADGPRELRCTGLGVLTERYPEARRLQSFSTLHDRLLNVAAVAQAGGPEAARKLAAAATRQMQEEHPKTRDWTVRELSMVRVGPDGSRMVQFTRKVPSKTDPGSVESWITTIIEMPGRETQVSVLAPESVVR